MIHFNFLGAPRQTAGHTNPSPPKPPRTKLTLLRLPTPKHPPSYLPRMLNWPRPLAILMEKLLLPPKLKTLATVTSQAGVDLETATTLADQQWVCCLSPAPSRQDGQATAKSPALIPQGVDLPAHGDARGMSDTEEVGRVCLNVSLPGFRGIPSYISWGYHLAKDKFLDLVPLKLKVIRKRKKAPSMWE